MIARIFAASLLMLFLQSPIFAQERSYQTSYVSFSASLPEQKLIREVLAKDATYSSLSAFEREFIYYLNYVRQYPGVFADKAVKPYLASYPEFVPVYGESLLVQLNSADTVGKLFPTDLLVKLARNHASDVSGHDLMSHNSSNGTSMQDRFQKAGLICGSECINMLSQGSAQEVLLSLLVDYRVKGFGHRKSLLSESMKTVGVGMKSSKSGLQYTVIDLGCD